MKEAFKFLLQSYPELKSDEYIAHQILVVFVILILLFIA
jgi:hypothetical protein